MMNTVVKWASYGYAFILIVFGCQHFMYVDFLDHLMSSWIPWHIFFIYFTGIALIAAGVSIATNKQRWLATRLLGIMILLFIPLMHIPILTNTNWAAGNITNACKDLGLACGALLISGLRERREEEEVAGRKKEDVMAVIGKGGRQVAGEGVIVD